LRHNVYCKYLGGLTPHLVSVNQPVLIGKRQARWLKILGECAIFTGMMGLILFAGLIIQP